MTRSRFKDINLGYAGNVKVNLSHEQRRRHMFVPGASDTGKSRFLEHLMRQDLLDPRKPGFLLIDPHGTLYDSVVHFCAVRQLDRRRKIHLLNPHIDGWACGVNPLKSANKYNADVIASTLRNAFCQVWGEDMSNKPGVREALDVVFYTLAINQLSLVEADQLTELRNIDQLQHFAETTEDPKWRGRVEHFLDMGRDRKQQEMFVAQMSAVGRRVSDFTSNILVRNMIGQTEDSLDLLDCMQNGDIVLANLRYSDRFSLENSRLLGTILINDLYVQAPRRSEEEGRRHPFYAYVDESHRYLTDDITDILIETRKYGVHLILALHFIEELKIASDKVYFGVMNGAQTKVVFGGLGSGTPEMAEQMFRTEISLERGVKATRAHKIGGYKTEVRYGGSSSTANIAGDSLGSSSSETGGPDGGQSIITVGATEASVDSNVETSAVNWHEVDVPILEEGYTQIHNVETMLFEKAALLEGLPTQHAIVKARGEHSVRFRVPDVHEMPNKEHSKLPLNFTKRVLLASPYTKPVEQIEQEASERAEKLVAPPTEPDSFRS